MKTLLRKLIRRAPAFSSRSYWEKRYAAGGNSGDGSYGRLAEYKASVISRFLKEHQIESAIEFGCGDGNQVSLIEYPKYLGLDVSASAVQRCAGRFADDERRSFMVYEPASYFNRYFSARLTLSLDVLYHIVEPAIFSKYLNDLFCTSEEYVIIYSTNYDKAETAHVLHRRFTDHVAQHIPGFELAEQLENPFNGTGVQESDAGFYIYRSIKNGKT